MTFIVCTQCLTVCDGTKTLCDGRPLCPQCYYDHYNEDLTPTREEDE